MGALNVLRAVSLGHVVVVLAGVQGLHHYIYSFPGQAACGCPVLSCLHPTVEAICTVTAGILASRLLLPRPLLSP